MSRAVMLLHWVQVQDPRIRTFELREGATRVATLRFRPPFSSRAVAESAFGIWEFRYRGLLRQRVTVCPVGREPVLAAYFPNFWGSQGILELPDERAFCWKEAGIQGDVYQFEDENGMSLVAIRPECHRTTEFCVFEMKASVEITLEGCDYADLLLLVLLGWYLIVSRKENTALVAPPF